MIYINIATYLYYKQYPIHMLVGTGTACGYVTMERTPAESRRRINCYRSWWVEVWYCPDVVRCWSLRLQLAATLITL
jgi:hypothetical protein